LFVDKTTRISSVKPFSSTQTLILDNISFTDAKKKVKPIEKKKLMENTFLFPTAVQN